MPELLLACQDLSKAFDARPLFEGLSFTVLAGDHVGVVGPNGSGKSTLLAILAGIEPPTSGTREVRRRLRIGHVPQDPVFEPGTTVDGALREAVAATGVDPHEADGRVVVARGRAGLEDGGARVSSLSGGWRKRLHIACAIAREPELLLLDEPTNHLDVDGILWLEDLLRTEPEAFLAVSHDRYFLEAVAGRVLQIDRSLAAGFLDVRGGYVAYLEKKAELLAQQSSTQESLRNRVRGELEWLSRKARARTRKAQARIHEASRLQEELADLDDRARRTTVGIDFAGTSRRTRRLLEATGVAKRHGERVVVQGLDVLLSPGMRLGLLGANGSGKTTVLGLLGGTTVPDAGTVQAAPGLRIVAFDQHRTALQPGVSLARILAPAGDAVTFHGRSLHVNGWAKRFGFRPEQMETPVDRLSGGEQARAAIARLMLEPADVLLLDEPTNDLDIPTLETLEESLLEFEGALVLVTHDRHLLERVATEILFLDGRGGSQRYADYAQWEMARRAPDARGAAPSGTPPPARAEGASAAKRRKLGYREQREWEQMEGRILEAERRRDECQRAAEDPAIAADHAALLERHADLAAAREAVERLYARWVELEAMVEP